MYDKSNIFAKFLSGEVPVKKIYEDEYAIAFNDINPQAPVHVLVIPKGEYTSFEDFSAKASDAEIAGYVRAIGKVSRQLELDKSGYRLLVNMGANGGQEVPHLHTHIFGGAKLGRMVTVDNTPKS
ncbi:MAG: histidine triad nucleotide-binding protein [Alphaproteobacteria bacterium]|nr:histidine triad nucleotide-binding protein [Alphaproteobacteria bacterium]